MDKATSIPLGVENLYDSQIKTHFTGLFNLVTTCSSCSTVTTTILEFREIYLSVTNNIKESIEKYLNHQRNQTCNSCQQLAAHNCSLKLMQSPKILIIILKRFDNSLRKITRKIEGSEVLSLENYEFDLASIITHLGTTINSGHYINTIPSGTFCKIVSDMDIRKGKLKNQFPEGYIYFYVKQGI